MKESFYIISYPPLLSTVDMIRTFGIWNILNCGLNCTHSWKYSANYDISRKLRSHIVKIPIQLIERSIHTTVLSYVTLRLHENTCLSVKDLSATVTSIGRGVHNICYINSVSVQVWVCSEFWKCLIYYDYTTFQYPIGMLPFYSLMIIFVKVKVVIEVSLAIDSF